MLEVRIELPSLFGWIPSLVKQFGLFQKRFFQELSVKFIRCALQSEWSQVLRTRRRLKRDAIGIGPLTNTDFPESLTDFNGEY